MDIGKMVKRVFTFIFFIIFPFICFLRVQYRFSEYGVPGMIIRLFNITMLPAEIVIVIALNLIGFLILSKNKVRNIITLVYLFIQSSASVILVIIFCKKGIGITGESLLANYIIKGVTYYRHSVIAMCGFNVLLFFIAVIISALKKLINDNRSEK